MRAPADQRAAIGRRQRGHRDAQCVERPGPAAVRAQPRPGCAAERQNGGARRERAALSPIPRSDSASSPKPSKAPRSKRTPCAVSRASSARSKGEALKLLGNTRPLVPMKVSSPSSAQNSRKPIRRKGADDRLQPLGRRAVAREENLQRLAVRQIESAAPGHQKFARGARLVVKDGDASARARQNIGGDEAGWPPITAQNGAGAEISAFLVKAGRIASSTRPAGNGNNC